MTKKLYAFLLFCILSVSAIAQNADFQKAVARFKGATRVTAVATRVDHKAAVAKDDKVTGTMTIVSPGKMNISVAGGKEQLDMNGNVFTMVMRGCEHKANSKKDNQFVAFQAVLTAIINGDGSGIEQVPGVTMTETDGILAITMDPTVGQAQKKRMMFYSFVITLDVKKGEIRSLRMNGRGKNYTEYSFSNFVFK
ncbi:MAG: hypothetical protein NC113_00565 [Bacteroides sp.]|nr:hypothetical protein [Bacteroides sp.]MCM1446718.1 hypothetical protein [Bacteroides sp.]MCM1514849.1 hypothetical protein [Paraprevotella sp.]